MLRITLHPGRLTTIDELAAHVELALVGLPIQALLPLLRERQPAIAKDQPQVFIIGDQLRKNNE
jgi:hypothetical protein